jgi:hypothetical protein
MAVNWPWLTIAGSGGSAGIQDSILRHYAGHLWSASVLHASQPQSPPGVSPTIGPILLLCGALAQLERFEWRYWQVNLRRVGTVP